MFNRKKRQQKLIETIGMIRPTSKASLKQTCLYLANLDVEKAEKMYDFLMKDMVDIPDVEPASKSFMQNFGDQANGVIKWLRENQDMITQGAEYIRSIVTKNPVPSASNIKPLPPINE